MKASAGGISEAYVRVADQPPLPITVLLLDSDLLYPSLLMNHDTTSIEPQYEYDARIEINLKYCTLISPNITMVSRQSF
jgi:hypothetical protein